MTNTTTTSTDTAATPAALTDGPFIGTVLSDTDAMVATYVSASKGTKATMRAYVTKSARTALSAVATDPTQLDVALAWNAVSVALDSVATATKAPVAVDYGQVARNRAATFRLAAFMIESGSVTPDGFPSDFVYADGPDVPDTDAAAALAGAKITRSGTRNDIGPAILSALDTVPAGTWLTGTDVARIMSLPSAGAVTAHLWTVAGAVRDDKVAALGVVVAGTGTPGDFRRISLPVVSDDTAE